MRLIQLGERALSACLPALAAAERLGALLCALLTGDLVEDGDFAPARAFVGGFGVEFGVRAGALLVVGGFAGALVGALVFEGPFWAARGADFGGMLTSTFGIALCIQPELLERLFFTDLAPWELISLFQS